MGSCKNYWKDLPESCREQTKPVLSKRTASAVPTCVLAGPCRSAVTVADEAAGTSSVGDFDRAGLVLLPSDGGSAVLGEDRC